MSKRKKSFAEEIAEWYILILFTLFMLMLAVFGGNKKETGKCATRSQQ